MEPKMAANQDNEIPRIDLLQIIREPDQAELLALQSLAIPTETELNAMRIAAKTDVDLTKIHCTKTGQPIANRSEEQLARLLKFHNVAKLTELVPFIDLASGVDPLWLHTGPDNLNKLQDFDPKGFFCYCINIALKSHHMQFGTSGIPRFQSIENERAYRNSLVKAWYQLNAFSLTELHEVNKHLRFYMYLNLHNQKLYKMPWHLMRAPNTEYDMLIAAFQTGKKAKPVGRSGKAGLMLVDDNDEKDIGNWEFHKLLKSRADAVNIYDSRTDPLFPHEFATERGISWMKACLNKFLLEIKRKMRSNEITYAHLQTASGFRRGERLATDMLPLLDFGDDIPADLPRYTIEELKARQNLIRYEKRRARTITEEELIELDIKLDNGMFQAGSKAKEPELNLPAPQPKPVEQKPAGVIKLNLGFLKNKK